MAIQLRGSTKDAVHLRASDVELSHLQDVLRRVPRPASFCTVFITISRPRSLANPEYGNGILSVTSLELPHSDSVSKGCLFRLRATRSDPHGDLCILGERTQYLSLLNSNLTEDGDGAVRRQIARTCFTALSEWYQPNSLRYQT